jgi:hypothetical protein
MQAGIRRTTQTSTRIWGRGQCKFLQHFKGIVIKERDQQAYVWLTSGAVTQSGFGFSNVVGRHE